VSFSSAVDAARAFHDVLPAEERTLEALALQTAIHQLCGECDSSADPKDILPQQRAS
jgi:hypothetical protein